MAIEIFDVPQGSDEWKAVKIGVPSASRFSDIMAQGQGKSRDKYMRQLAGEIISEIPMETFRSKAMEHGTQVEPEARNLYAMLANCEVQQVGFIKNGRVGCSPDGMISEDGMLELKRSDPADLIERWRDKGFKPPSEHMAQLQGNLMVADRKWIDIGLYFPKMPMWRMRVKRDEHYIARMRVGIEQFIEDLDELVKQVRGYGL